MKELIFFLIGVFALTVNCANKNNRISIYTIDQPVGKFTYTVSTTECYSDSTPTNLGPNFKFYQYYSFSLKAGAVSLSSYSVDTRVTSLKHDYDFYACKKTHLYNWMAQPALASPSSTAGLGSQLVAYGY